VFNFEIDFIIKSFNLIMDFENYFIVDFRTKTISFKTTDHSFVNSTINCWIANYYSFKIGFATVDIMDLSWMTGFGTSSD